MPTPVSPQWQEKARGFFSTSGAKLKEAGQSASENVGLVAERAGSLVKRRWTLIQQGTRPRPASVDTMQERIINAAASTGNLLKRGLSETKEKVADGRIKVEEAAKKTAIKSKSILNNIERWQKGVASDDVFGVPIDITVQQQVSRRPIPQILVNCADFLIFSGLNKEYLFKSEGDRKVLQQLISLFNSDRNASLPEGVKPIDVAALIKCYLASLPEPLTTFKLYHEIRDARSSIREMRNILKKLPSVNYMTLEYVTALLLHVSQKSTLNKMDAHSLAVELAPVVMWQNGFRRSDLSFRYYQGSNMSSTSPPKPANPISLSPWDNLSDEENDNDASSPVPLDDGFPTDFGAIEVIQCLIEHHNAIFSDANETIWK
ncbi:uncharacterized Rho GTPase-activating protein At5g61530 [Aristolochia californica]|uniref:uncharacterized Rho GTPase-activating protein At5g61530 n=1 Tax=Aristolochia californica TaxID=171875 RepID=UPI0035D5E7A3